jgi:CheY-like chemotaxis protein
MYECTNESLALVIDDDSDQYELTKAILADEGFSVLTADNAEEGLMLFNHYHPFVIITDFGMPDMGGAELIENIRTDYGEDVPVILMSAYSPDYIRKHIHPGFAPDVILSKPVDFDLLICLVKSFYRRHFSQSLAIG